MARDKKSEIERFERDTAISPSVKGVDYSTEQVDTRPLASGLAGLGRSLLANAEPIMQARAEKAAVVAAGAAVPLARDLNGNLVRPEPMRGGGTVYAQTFTKAVNVAYRQELDFQNQHDFDQIYADNYDDPQAAWGAYDAKFKAVMATVPDDLKLDVAADMHREITQRFTGLNNGKLSRDRELKVAELHSQYDMLWKGYIKDVTTLVEASNYPAVAARVAQQNQQIQANQDARIAMHLLTPGPEGGEGTEDQYHASMMAEVQADITSAEGINGIIMRAKEYSEDREALTMLTNWVKGDFSQGKGKFLGMTWAEYVKLIPTERGRTYMANEGARLITEMDNKAQRERQAAEDAKVSATETNLQIAKSTGVDGTTNPALQVLIDKEEADWLMANGGNPTNAMLLTDPKTGESIGGQHLMAVVANNSYLPKQWKAFLDNNVDGTNANAVVGILGSIANIKNKTGQLIGRRILREQVSDYTKAAASLFTTLRDQGMHRAEINNVMGQLSKNGLMSEADAKKLYVDEDGKDIYFQQIDKETRNILNSEFAKLPADVQRDIKKSVPVYLSVYGQNYAAQAVRQAVNGVAATWTPSPYGVGGYIPAELAVLDLNDAEMDYAFGNYTNGAANPWNFGGGFSLKYTNADGVKVPRAQIHLVEDSQIGTGLGVYSITYFDKNGDPIPGSTHEINIDEGVRRAAHIKGKLQDEINARKAVAAKKARDTREKLARDKKVDIVTGLVPMSPL